MPAAHPRCTAHLPDGPITLTTISTESTSDDHTFHGENRLWLPRLPPPTPFDLTLEWPGLDITPATTTLDGAALNQAARHAQPLWP